MVREEIILNKIKGKDVLDIGSMGQTEEYSLWKLYQGAGYKSLTGIDLPDAEEQIKKIFKVDHVLRQENIVFGNMENYDFERQFDVIIAGDVIEHVDNQGLFLRNIHKHLKQEGELILTTPNAKWITALTEPNPTHTLWHDQYTLKRILNLCGLEVEKLIFYYGNKKNYNLIFKLLTIRQSMLVICKKIKK